MFEWLIERGIGETRCAAIEGSRIVEARITREGRLHAGQQVQAKLVRKEGGRGFAEVPGETLLVEPWPEGVAEGATLTLVVTRAAIPERGRMRDAKARAADAEHANFARTADEAVRAAEKDLSQFGWEELIEEARTGVAAFPGGLLAIVPTPAGTTIDVDGDLPREELGLRGAAAAARAIRRLDITGSILLDLPSLEGKAARQAAAAEVDRHLPSPFERTGVNGFGLLQIVRPRRRASLLELVQNLPEETGALDLLRRAERCVPAVRLDLRAGARIAAWLQARPAYLDELARRTGARIALNSHGRDPLWWGDVHQVR